MKITRAKRRALRIAVTRMRRDDLRAEYLRCWKAYYRTREWLDPTMDAQNGAERDQLRNRMREISAELERAKIKLR